MSDQPQSDAPKPRNSGNTWVRRVLSTIDFAVLVSLAGSLLLGGYYWRDLIERLSTVELNAVSKAREEARSVIRKEAARLIFSNKTSFVLSADKLNYEHPVSSRKIPGATSGTVDATYDFILPIPLPGGLKKEPTVFLTAVGQEDWELNAKSTLPARWDLAVDEVSTAHFVIRLRQWHGHRLRTLTVQYLVVE